MWPRRFASTFTASRTKKLRWKQKLRPTSKRKTRRQGRLGCVRLLRLPRQRPLPRPRLLLRLLLLRLLRRHPRQQHRSQPHR
jgi:hypothetical protein